MGRGGVEGELEAQEEEEGREKVRGMGGKREREEREK